MLALHYDHEKGKYKLPSIVNCWDGERTEKLVIFISGRFISQEGLLFGHVMCNRALLGSEQTLVLNYSYIFPIPSCALATCF